MRRLLAFLSFPILAASPVSVKVVQASVTWGSGVEPKGTMPPGRFQAQVCLAGDKVPAHPVFRLWRIKLGDYQALEKRHVAFPTMKKTQRLAATATASVGGTWLLQGTWSDAPNAEDRLIVEVRSGARRLGWTVFPLAEQLIPTAGKPTEASREDHR